jgi:hypothetical protein
MHLCICNMYPYLILICCLKCVLIYHMITCLHAYPRVVWSVFKCFSSFLIFTPFIVSVNASVVQWSEFLVTDPDVQVRSWCYQIVWGAVELQRGPLSLVSTNEELLRRKSSGSRLEKCDYGRRDPSRWPRDNFYPKKLTLTSPTSGGLSIGMFRRLNQTTECSSVFLVFFIVSVIVPYECPLFNMTLIIWVTIFSFFFLPWSESTSELCRPSGVIANFCGQRVPRGQLDGSLRPYSRFSRQEPLLFYQVAPQLYSRGRVDPVPNPLIFFW